MPSSPTHKNLDSLIEGEDSGEYSIGANGIIQTRIFRAKYSVCVANILFVGASGTGEQLGYQVQNCNVKPIGSEQGQLTIVWEASGASSGATLPPDEVGVAPDNQSPRIERHPMFKPLENKTIIIDTETVFVLSVVENALRTSDPKERAKLEKKLVSEPLALKLLEKMRRGMESFYMASLRYIWATHSWTIPTISRGGFRQAPQGPLANYFAADIDFLREADDLSFHQGIWRWTRSWTGAVGAHWDPDIFF